MEFSNNKSTNRRFVIHLLSRDLSVLFLITIFAMLIAELAIPGLVTGRINVVGVLLAAIAAFLMFTATAPSQNGSSTTSSSLPRWVKFTFMALITLVAASAMVRSPWFLIVTIAPVLALASWMVVESASDEN